MTLLFRENFLGSQISSLLDNNSAASLNNSTHGLSRHKTDKNTATKGDGKFRELLCKCF